MLSLARFSRFAALTLAGVALSGCGSTRSKPAATTATGATSSISGRDAWGTAWLCRPGAAGDPCTSALTTTVVARNGSTRVERAAPAARPRVDCFYVYPTISGQQTVNANLAVDFRLQEVAIAQASRFSQVCRVFAPVYRQITLRALDHPSSITLPHARVAYDSVVSSFHDYLAHYNHGRGIVFIGHSQGAAILIRLLQQEVDGAPALRRRLVSALLLGGNVTVAKDSSVGGDFAHIPACRSDRQTGCVVAYSSFTSKPPKNSQFGRTSSDAGVSLLAPPKSPTGLAIMCVNPASLGDGSGVLDPYLPSLVLGFLPSRSAPAVTTPWVAFPGEYVARCESSGNASWLQITPAWAGRSVGPSLTRLRDPTLGLHILDVNIALGNLVRLVRHEAAAYRGT
jgi:Protein of unknown function (DUF3089)